MGKIAELQKALAEVVAQRDKEAKAHADEYRLRYAADEAVKNTRAQFDDLKKRLLDSETECARLRGYMERVREDDAVADPLVEIEDGNGKRMVSKRYPSNAHHANGYTDMDMGTAPEFDGYGNRRQKPKHWVAY